MEMASNTLPPSSARSVVERRMGCNPHQLHVLGHSHTAPLLVRVRGGRAARIVCPFPDSATSWHVTIQVGTFALLAIAAACFLADTMITRGRPSSNAHGVGSGGTSVQ